MNNTDISAHMALVKKWHDDVLSPWEDQSWEAVEASARKLAAPERTEQAAPGFKRIGWTCGEGDCGRIHDTPSADDSYAVPVYVSASPTAQPSVEPVALSFQQVGETQHLLELNDEWLQNLPVGTPLFTNARTGVGSDGLSNEDRAAMHFTRDEANHAIERSASKPVAWMHDAEGRVDVIHDAVKNLLLDQHVKGYSSPDYMHRPLGKVEHYTVPLYATPPPAPVPFLPGEQERLTENGRKAWSGVDAQELREGGPVLSDAEINHLVDTHVGGPTPSYPLGPEDWINFARAIEQAIGRATK